jgi:hypothetical protein
MEMENIYTAVIALIAGLTTSQAWGYWKKKLELKKENDTEYKYECRARIEKLEDLLEDSNKEKQEMRKTIFFDLMCLKMEETEDNKYHYKLLKDNLIDLMGYPKEE